MKTYIRLLRLQDQYLPWFAVVSAGVYGAIHTLIIIWWAIAGTFLSLSAFLVNEIVDARDTDRYSWNPIHAISKEALNKQVVWGLVAIFAVLGFFVSYYLRLLGWAVVIYSIGVVYSVRPIRLKGRIILDIISQLLVCWVLPFLAVVWNMGDHGQALWFVSIVGFIIWFAFYPYQITDLPADRRVGLKNTHVLLGARKSLYLSAVLGVVGGLLYIWLGLYKLYPWTVPFLGIMALESYFYIRWLRIRSESACLTIMRKDVRVFKIIALFLVPYLLSVWLGIIPLSAALP